MTYDQMTRSAENVLVEFYVTWCPHCRAMEPAVDEISEMLEGQVKIVKLDVDQNADASEAEDVTGTPTFILYRNGRKLWRVSGEMPGDVLLNKITSHI